VSALAYWRMRVRKALTCLVISWVSMRPPQGQE
jgi:hypothetical protein